MRKIKTYFSALCIIIYLLFANGCSDLSQFQDDITALQNRVTALETLCKNLNNNIDAVQTIATAMQNGNYITSVTPVMYNGEEIGYTISFVKGDPITIYHGEGGNIPGIGVRKDVDDLWYWTINSEWLLDSNGQRVKASGTDGTDGITPRLKIEDGYWFVTMDEGVSWTKLGQATGDKGADGDSFFKSVSEDDTHVYFTLANGSVLALQKAQAGSIKMALGSYIPVIESREVRIYYKSLFAVYDVYRYQVMVEGKIGKPYPRFWSFTPSSSDSGKSYDVCFSLVDDDGSIITSKTTSIKCLPSPSFSDKNILVIGASIYSTGSIAREMSRQLTQTGGNPSGYGLSGINFIGRLTGSIETDIHQEATGGWSWYDFTNTSDDNPFYNPSEDRVDFKYYSQQYCNSAPIDVLCIEHGWNSLTTNVAIVESVIKPFLRQYHKDYPNGVIVLGGLQPPSQQGGLGTDYGSSSEWNWLTVMRNVMDYNNEVDKICQDAEFRSYVYYWAACEMFDCENAYPTSEIPSSLRTDETEVIETNGLHPTVEGRLQLADSGVLAICNALSQ